MDLAKLFDMQKELDDRIALEHLPTEKEDRLNKKIIAFLVEVSEMLNEKRTIFKFWSKKQDDNDKALIEFADGLHFLLSIGLELGKRLDYSSPYILDYDFIDAQILEVYRSASDINRFSYDQYERVFELYLGLGEMLGFSWEQIEEAYLAKNKVNHMRQDNGY